MNSTRLLATTVCCALVLTALPALALDLGGHDRDGTVVGLNFGCGWNKLKYDTSGGESETDTDTAFTGGLSIGWARNDNLIGSIGIYGWKESLYQGITPVSVSTFNFLAEVSWFPRGEGFWIKGGIGGGTLDVYAVFPLSTVNFQEGGWAYTAGAGYEFRVSDGTAIGIAYDYRTISTGDSDSWKNTSASTHALAFNIRFYMM